LGPQGGGRTNGQKMTPGWKKREGQHLGKVKNEVFGKKKPGIGALG